MTPSGHPLSRSLSSYPYPCNPSHSPSLPLSQLEDIYASLFLVACNNKLIRAVRRIGEKQWVADKITGGALLFFLLAVVLWAPMLVGARHCRHAG